MALRRDGSTVEVELSAAPIRDSDGAITGAALTVLDVPSAGARSGCWSASSRTRRTRSASRTSTGATCSSATRPVRRPSPDAVGRTDAELFPPDVATRSVEQDRIVLARGTPTTFRETIRFRDGPDHQFVTTKFPLLGPNGGLEGVGVIASDVTELRQAELDQARLAALVEAAPDAIVALDKDGRIVTWNPGAEAVFGLSAEAAIGRSYADLLVPDDERARFDSLLAEAQSGRTLTVRAVRRRGDGSRFPAQVSVAPLTLLDGTWSGRWP